MEVGGPVDVRRGRRSVHIACVLNEVVFPQSDCRCARSTGLSKQNAARALPTRHISPKCMTEPEQSVNETPTITRS